MKNRRKMRNKNTGIVALLAAVVVIMVVVVVVMVVVARFDHTAPDSHAASEFLQEKINVTGALMLVLFPPLPHSCSTSVTVSRVKVRRASHNRELTIITIPTMIHFGKLQCDCQFRRSPFSPPDGAPVEEIHTLQITLPGNIDVRRNISVSPPD
ncbi:hypothetical protein E2C01_020779 [Portunus trituberculatus]|uniref:Uncharacterized protein n=1 Tax=Portunus trituberculatus TaxID=210409 RepID=A0A5B7E2H4_PORTR|nr:hypothetical protein [Portunus trituberculatus]